MLLELNRKIRYINHICIYNKKKNNRDRERRRAESGEWREEESRERRRVERGGE